MVCTLGDHLEPVTHLRLLMFESLYLTTCHEVESPQSHFGSWWFYMSNYCLHFNKYTDYSNEEECFLGYLGLELKLSTPIHLAWVLGNRAHVETAIGRGSKDEWGVCEYPWKYPKDRLYLSQLCPSIIILFSIITASQMILLLLAFPFQSNLYNNARLPFLKHISTPAVPLLNILKWSNISKMIKINYLATYLSSTILGPLIPLQFYLPTTLNNKLEAHYNMPGNFLPIGLPSYCPF